MKLPWSEPDFFLSKITRPRCLELPIAGTDFDSPFEFEPAKIYCTIFYIVSLLTNDAYNELRSRVTWTSLSTNSTVFHIAVVGYIVNHYCLRFDRGAVHIATAGYILDH